VVIKVIRKAIRERAWWVGERAELVIAQQEPMGSPAVYVAAHGPATIVDAEGHSEPAGAWGIDGDEVVVVLHKPMAPEADISPAFTVVLALFSVARCLGVRGDRRGAQEGERAPA
jgi:hypothetical protein